MKTITRIGRGKILINSKEFELKEDEIELLFSKNINEGERKNFFQLVKYMTYGERKEFLTLV